jgi:hypothetical protein
VKQIHLQQESEVPVNGRHKVRTAYTLAGQLQCQIKLILTFDRNLLLVSKNAFLKMYWRSRIHYTRWRENNTNNSSLPANKLHQRDSLY